MSRIDDRRELALNLLLVVLSVTMVTAGFEVALRTGIVQPARSPDQVRFCDDGNQRGQFHPTYGWTERPNTTYLEKSSLLDEWSRFTHNQYGFRDTYDSGNGSGIVVLGDSTTHGSLVGENRTYSALLERATPETAVHNYGIGGYSTAQELLVYRTVADRHEHDVVVLTYSLGNDMIGNTANRTNQPRFALQDGELVLVHEPEPRPARNQQPGLVRSVHRTFQTSVATYNWLFARSLPLLTYLGIATPSAEYPPPETDWEGMEALTRALIETVASEAASRDAELVLVPVPPRGEVYPGQSHHPLEASKPYWRSQRTMLQSIAEDETNVHYVDPRPSLVEAAENGSRVYGRVDGHLDDPGHYVLATQLKKQLEERGHLPGAEPIQRLPEDAEPRSCP